MWLLGQGVAVRNPGTAVWEMLGAQRQAVSREEESRSSGSARACASKALKK